MKRAEAYTTIQVTGVLFFFNDDRYPDGKISIWKAKELAGAKNEWEMLLILDLKGIWVNYSAGDAKKEVKNLKSGLKRE